jgi:hypothetical protein
MDVDIPIEDEVFADNSNSGAKLVHAPEANVNNSMGSSNILPPDQPSVSPLERSVAVSNGLYCFSRLFHGLETDSPFTQGVLRLAQMTTEGARAIATKNQPVNPSCAWWSVECSVSSVVWVLNVMWSSRRGKCSQPFMCVVECRV